MGSESGGECSMAGMWYSVVDGGGDGGGGRASSLTEGRRVSTRTRVSARWYKC